MYEIQVKRTILNCWDKQIEIRHKRQKTCENTLKEQVG